MMDTEEILKEIHDNDLLDLALIIRYATEKLLYLDRLYEKENTEQTVLTRALELEKEENNERKGK